jgi:hypothetical protein
MKARLQLFDDYNNLISEMLIFGLKDENFKDYPHLIMPIKEGEKNERCFNN